MESFTESFLRESIIAKEFENMDDLYSNIDDRVNYQIAQSMKKVVHMIVEKFDRHVQEKLKLIVSEEVEMKLKEKEDAKNEKK